MPRTVDFTIPFPVRINPHLEQVRARHEAWVRESGLVPPAFEAQYYEWDFLRLGSYAFPDADPAGLYLASRLLGFTFMWDDQHEALSLRDPLAARKHSEEMIRALDGGEVTTLGARIMADMWKDMSRGMSNAWLTRARYTWNWCVATYPHQAHDALHKTVPSRRSYDHTRRGVAGVDYVLDVLERFLGCEVPATAAHSPQIWILRDTIVKATLYTNDVYSLEKEEADGDTNNIVLVLLAEGHTRSEALAMTVTMVTSELENFTKVREELLSMYAFLRLSPYEVQAVERYVEGLTAWISGYFAWSQTTPRYAGVNLTEGRRMPLTHLVD
ncbi:hypothetical protein [Streptomyces sp. NPDC018045]|uniref:terpene synthase family protein n=1 Tax=Streptomyces sp. NPDC018045 TaxID=3365037 RepID=UPI0037985935